MIDRITLRDFAVARDLTVELGPGLNVFTGETGAGKSLLVDALAFAFGARRGREVIATGAARASVEVDARADGRTVTIERAISSAGRSVARVDGTTATLDDLLSLAVAAIDIHGQADQLALLRPAVQRSLLDAFAGADTLRSALAERVRELREVRRALAALQTDARERERRLDQLRFETAEIAEAALDPGEDEALRLEQRRLASAGLLLESSSAALAALDSPAIGDLAAAVKLVGDRDATAGVLADLSATLESTAEELRRELRRYRDSIDDDPARLDEVGRRLDLIARLRRKYGDTIEAILAYRDRAADELRLLEQGGASLDELTARQDRLLPLVGDAAGRLSSLRRLAARDLVVAVAAELGQLGMGGASLAVGFETLEDPSGPPVALPDYDRVDAGWTPLAGEPSPREVSESGADRVEFLTSFNPGQEPRSLSAVASGGETSRFLLAVSAVLARSAPPRTIVFDEVDEGVGGRSGSLVGSALLRLAERHQVLCITHLPQVAAYGGRHFVVAKRDDGQRTSSTITPVDGEDRVRELAAMLGGVTAENERAALALLRSLPAGAGVSVTAG